MELGQRLKQARLEAGLSQRQLCGDAITRNMLSQIENGTARPSMDTLQYLASRLGKSVGYFVEGAATSPNQELVLRARAAYAAHDPAAVLKLLENYQSPDTLWDAECFLLRCLSLLTLAEGEADAHTARQLLAQAREAGVKTPYCTAELERRRLLCLARHLPQQVFQLDDEELLLRAAAALSKKDTEACIGLLKGANHPDDARWLLLRGDAAMAEENLSDAAVWYHRAESLMPEQTYPRLEQLYSKLEDYKKAYEYACKQRK